MGRLIVFEETGEVRPAKPGELFQQGYGVAWAVEKIPRNEMILRRLTDEEVDALVTPKPADDERGRFVRETAAMVMAHQFAMWTVAEIEDGDHSVSYSEGAIDQIVKAAESLAARLWEKRA